MAQGDQSNLSPGVSGAQNKKNGNSIYWSFFYAIKKALTLTKFTLYDRNCQNSAIWVIMLKFVLSELAKPIIRRCGSMLAGALLGIGATQPQAAELEQYLTASILIIIDLIMSYMERNNASD
jgi:hypothetical protein